MTAEALQQAIKKRDLPAVLYLHGEEFLQQQTLAKIERALIEPGSEDFNRQVFYGRNLDISQLLDAVMTLPAFAPRRLVIVKEAQHLVADDYERLAAYVENPVAETCLVFCADKIDNRRKFFQQLKKRDALVGFSALAESQIPAFVRDRLEERNFQITSDALQLFMLRVGSGLHEIATETEKLMLYAGEGRLLDVADVQAVVSSTRSENIFDIGNAVAGFAAGKALALGRALLAEGEPPVKILVLLTRHFRQLWRVRELEADGCPRRDLAARAGVPPFVVDRLSKQGKGYTRSNFKRAFALFLEADLAMKSSGARPDVVLEQLLSRLATQRKSGQDN
jgi:DNA polymerase-3 subunit delta